MTAHVSFNFPSIKWDLRGLFKLKLTETSRTKQLLIQFVSPFQNLPGNTSITSFKSTVSLFQGLLHSTIFTEDASLVRPCIGVFVSRWSRVLGMEHTQKHRRANRGVNRGNLGNAESPDSQGTRINMPVSTHSSVLNLLNLFYTLLCAQPNSNTEEACQSQLQWLFRRT